jgi:hypothetical protein
MLHVLHLIGKCGYRSAPRNEYAVFAPKSTSKSSQHYPNGQIGATLFTSDKFDPYSCSFLHCTIIHAAPSSTSFCFRGLQMKRKLG